MKQQDFEARFAPRWEVFEAWLERGETFPGLRGKRPGGTSWPPDAATLDPAQVPGRYREICQHLALAQDRQYSSELIERLSRLAFAGHQRLYGARGHLSAPIARFLLRGFPAAVRAHRRYVLLAALLFFGPLLALTLALQRYPDFTYVVLDADTVEQFAEMYGESTKELGRTRDAGDDVVMFAYYIWNNVRIGFQTFAGGLVFGLGTLFYLLYNGLHIGVVTGYLVHAGLGPNFFSFTSGHSAFELTAIALCGAAGLRLGAALVDPGRRRRGESLRHAAREAMPLVVGSALMFVLAAMIEAFWSPRREFPLMVKYGFGIALWLVTLAYFAAMGRRDAA
jgi:uncharacterized membrane protein SpoIIM required for sporulation